MNKVVYICIEQKKHFSFLILSLFLHLFVPTNNAYIPVLDTILDTQRGFHLHTGPSSTMAVVYRSTVLTKVTMPRELRYLQVSGVTAVDWFKFKCQERQTGSTNTPYMHFIKAGGVSL